MPHHYTALAGRFFTAAGKDVYEGIPLAVGERESIDARIQPLTQVALREGYFENEPDADIFGQELAFLLASKRATLAIASSSAKETGRHSSVNDMNAVAAYMSETATTASHQDTIVDLPDAFLHAAVRDEEWNPGGVLRANAERARAILERIAQTGNAQLQFSSAIAAWHTTPNGGPIVQADVSTGYLGLEGVVTPVAKIHLASFVLENGMPDAAGIHHCVEVLTIALECLVVLGGYETNEVAKRTKAYRPIALTCDTIEDFLEAQQLAYDSAEARARIATTMALVTGRAYATSAHIARRVGPFAGFRKDQTALLKVLRMHRAAVPSIDAALVTEDLLSAAATAWDEVIDMAELYGVRNAQVTGLGLDSFKENVDQRSQVMMAAGVQPYVSGAAIAALRLDDATLPTVLQLIINGWRSGLKVLELHGTLQQAEAKVVPEEGESTMNDVPNTTVTESVAAPTAASAAAVSANTQGPVIVQGAVHRLLPRRRNSKTYKFSVADSEGFFTVSEYDDGTPGELFVHVAKEGSTLSGLLDSLAIAVSYGLQYGVPLKTFARTMIGTSFGPAGSTDDPDIRTASSVTDYIFRRMALDYLTFDDRVEIGMASLEDMSEEQTTLLTDD